MFGIDNYEQNGEGSFYFGDKMSLMRIGMIVRPTLCNYTAKHPNTIYGELN